MKFSYSAAPLALATLSSASPALAQEVAKLGVRQELPEQALRELCRNGAEAAAGVYADLGDKEDNLSLRGDGTGSIAGSTVFASPTTAF